LRKHKRKIQTNKRAKKGSLDAEARVRVFTDLYPLPGAGAFSIGGCRLIIFQAAFLIFLLVNEFSGKGQMNADSIALLIDDTNQYESSLAWFLIKLYGNIDKTTYEMINEQVEKIRKTLEELKDLLRNPEVEIQ